MKSEITKEMLEAAKMEEYDCSIAEYERIFLEGANHARQFIVKLANQMADEIPDNASVFEQGQADGLRWLVDNLKSYEED